MGEMIAKVLHILGKVELAFTLATAWVLYHGAVMVCGADCCMIKLEDGQVQLVNIFGLFGLARVGAWYIAMLYRRFRNFMQQRRIRALQVFAVAELRKILQRGRGGEFETLLALCRTKQMLASTGDPVLLTLVSKGIAYRSGALVGYADGRTVAGYSLTPHCALFMEECGRDGDA